VIERARRSESAAGWLFTAPAALLILGFGLIPIGWSFLLSFQHSDLVTPPSWVGLDNYRTLLDDPVFRASVRRTLVYTVLFVPISVGAALFLAMLLNSRVRGIWAYRTAVFVPVAVSTVATAVIFNWLLDPNYGVVNYALGKVGVGAQGFFQDPDQALYAIVAMTVWGWVGFDVIVYLAGLQGIPRELYEAAEMDGAGRWSSFRHITWPMLGPVTLFLVVWSTINAMQVFDEIYVTTRGGPLQSTTVVVYYLYQQAFQFFAGGYATAIAYTVFAAILVLTAVQLWIGSRRVHYS
jgi:multiple sugar transport system permease protein